MTREPPDWQAEIQRLLAKVAELSFSLVELRAEVERLKARNARLEMSDDQNYSTSHVAQERGRIVRCPHCRTDFTPSHLLAEVDQLHEALRAVHAILNSNDRYKARSARLYLQRVLAELRASSTT